jgi:hypothetical protein
MTFTVPPAALRMMAAWNAAQRGALPSWLPPHARDHDFTWSESLGIFDLTAAREWAETVPRPVRQLPVARWARDCGLAPPAGTASPEYADKEKPVIVGSIFGLDLMPIAMLLDGHERLRGATMAGWAKIPAYVLTVGETEHLCWLYEPPQSRQRRMGYYGGSVPAKYHHTTAFLN